MPRVAAAGAVDHRWQVAGRAVRHRPTSLALAVAIVAGACAGGAATRAPQSPEGSVQDFHLTTTAFAPGGSIPTRFTCDGGDVSPDLAWSGTPAGAGALVLVVDDPDAGGFVHWIAFDLTASGEGSLPLGVSASPDAPPQGTNDFGTVGWGGPCPPSGEHRYRFTLTAIAVPLGLTGAPRAGEVRDALRGASVLGSAVLEGRYARP